MTPDIGILTTLFNGFMNAFADGIGFINGDARWLLGTLMVIDLLLAVLLNLSDGDHMKTLVTKILKYGFFIWLVMDYRSLVQVVFDSFQMIGLKAGGGAITNAMLSDPSALADQGILSTAPIFEHLRNISAINMLANLPDMIFTGLIGLLVVFCFFVIGIQIFITYLEFYVVGALALIVLPFGVNKHTAFLGEKAIGAVLSFGIKLMVLAFIAAVAIPLVKTWALPVDPTLKQALCLLLGSLAITFLAWHAPGIASGLLSGHPTLTGGSAAGFGLAAGAAALGVGYLGAQAGRTGYNMTKTAAAGGARVAGAYSSGGFGGVANLAESYASSGANKVADFVRAPFNEGREAGNPILSNSGSERSSDSSASTRSTPMRSPSEIMHRLNYVRNSVPPESHTGGGAATPNLKKE